MNEQAVFFQLTHKFVRQQGTNEPPPLQESSPAMAEAARQVIYYSLAIGHHVGVMDCFQPLLSAPLDEYRRLVRALPEGAAREKLEGLLRWGEIEINSSHAPALLAALQQVPADLSAHQQDWVGSLTRALQHMQQEPVYYLMGRRYVNGTPQHFGPQESADD